MKIAFCIHSEGIDGQGDMASIRYFCLSHVAWSLHHREFCTRYNTILISELRVLSGLVHGVYPVVYDVYNAEVVYMVGKTAGSTPNLILFVVMTSYKKGGEVSLKRTSPP
jgi:hypothetical protein